MIRRVSSKGMSQDESAKNHIKDNNWRGIDIFPTLMRYQTFTSPKAAAEMAITVFSKC